MARTAGALPARADLEPYAPPIFDQGSTGSCVGHARSRGIYAAAAAGARPLCFIPSPVDLYRLARCYERGDWGAPLVDDGCDPVDTLDAARRWGIRPMMGPLAEGRFSDADPATVNDNPTLAELQADRFTRVADDRSITQDPVRETMQALASGHPVCIDVAGGSAAWQTYDNASGPLMATFARLDHYVVLLGYETQAGGAVLFHGHNSWGTGWGRKGGFAADSSVVRAALDLIVCGGVIA